MQDAFAKALEVWPAQGLPAAPAAWLTTVARRRAVDLLRRRATGPVYTDEPPDMAAPEAGSRGGATGRHVGVEDDRLRLVFTCCHPAIAQRRRWRCAAHARRPVDAGDRPRLSRAGGDHGAAAGARQAKIRDARIPYEVPSRELLPERLAGGARRRLPGVQRGLRPHRGDGLVRTDLCSEAIRLGRLLVELLPEEPEARACSP